MYTYQQSTGKLTSATGELLCVGYSGRNVGLNNPSAQHVPKIGPVPQGEYTIGAAEDNAQLGPLAMPLKPDANNQMFGRSGFFVHGDNVAMDHTASEGCIILPHGVRETIAAGDDRRLQVIQ